MFESTDCALNGNVVTHVSVTVYHGYHTIVAYGDFVAHTDVVLRVATSLVVNEVITLMLAPI